MNAFSYVIIVLIDIVFCSIVIYCINSYFDKVNQRLSALEDKKDSFLTIYNDILAKQSKLYDLEKEIKTQFNELNTFKQEIKIQLADINFNKNRPKSIK